MTNDELIAQHLDGIDAQQAQRDIDDLPAEPEPMTLEIALAMYDNIRNELRDMRIELAQERQWHMYWQEMYSQLRARQVPVYDNGWALEGKR